MTAHATGVAADIATLLDLLATFAAGQGWTVRRNALTGGLLRELVLERDSDEVWGIAGIGGSGAFEIDIRGATSWDSGQSWDAQPGGDSVLAMDGLVQPVAAYDFYGSADYLHVVVTVADGQYRMLMLGVLDKAGSYTGGAYYAANGGDGSTDARGEPYSPFSSMPFDDLGTNAYGGTIVRADLDGNTNYWLHAVYNEPSRRLLTSYRNGYHLAKLVDRGLNDFSGVTTLQPIRVSALRPGGYFSPLGQVPGLRVCNHTWFEPGALMPPDNDWRIFPPLSTDLNVLPNSGIYGLAFATP